MLRFTIFLVCVLAPFTISKAISNPKCPPLCRMYCKYGNVLDENGCPICKCKPSPCGNEQAPLPNYFCGSGLNHQDCPLNSTCVIAPDDSYAVCCSSNEQSPTKPVIIIEKPGSCPPSSNTADNCYDECISDTDCEGDFKCCGSCPRVCVAPSI
ncbi:unnamed protein product [Rotaria sp. Silwood2]|nr:unnamed protein product [Rotaria sp. Silwood2]CAF2965106.1 unnamed protein product [Rotaria sp. Silwood2]CAF3117706.1 unnamed protein product [Rotaria sp. Silwood2]CAF4128813.1 unnamed protein product [Rotaria sp. Silwood2]CAF4277969.1 unnamed protein product [Rotaria sp. Silwood2]